MNALQLNGVNYVDYDKVYQDLADKHATPTYAFDLAFFERRITQFQGYLAESFGKAGIQTEIAYAGKAFLSKKVAALVTSKGLSVDTCTLLEAKTALQAGLQGSQIGLHGNNKSDEELALAIENNFARIIVDSEEEIGRIESIVDRLEKIHTKIHTPTHRDTSVFLRVTTGVHAGGHEYISTAHEDQKFGISLANGRALATLEGILQTNSLDLQGIHAHIGSQISAPEGFLASATKLLQLRTDLQRKTGYLLPEIDLGGGFGVQYTVKDDELDLAALFSELATLITEHCLKYNEELPKVAFEPGRWLIAPCMSTIYSVGTIKDVDTGNGTRRYVSVDGGMADNIRPVLYSAEYSAYVICKNTSKNTSEYISCRIVGKHCESGDIIVKNVELPEDLRREDLLVIPVTGAYGYSMASNYNMLVKPAVIGFYGTEHTGDYQEIIPRQSETEVIK